MSDDDLILRHISRFSGVSPAEARLCEEGVPVWVIVAYDAAVQHDTCAVADTYHVSPDAVRAARAFYRRHQALLDAKIAVASAAFA